MSVTGNTVARSVRARTPMAQRLRSAEQGAAEEVDALVVGLESRLRPAERRLLHELRLAAETLGGGPRARRRDAEAVLAAALATPAMSKDAAGSAGPPLTELVPVGDSYDTAVEALEFNTDG